MKRMILFVILLVIFVLILVHFTEKKKSVRSKEVVITSFGGTFQEAQRKAFFEPFEKATGIKIREVNYSGEYSKNQGNGSVQECYVGCCRCRIRCAIDRR